MKSCGEPCGLVVCFPFTFMLRIGGEVSSNYYGLIAAASGVFTGLCLISPQRIIIVKYHETVNDMSGI